MAKGRHMEVFLKPVQEEETVVSSYAIVSQSSSQLLTW